MSIDLNVNVVMLVNRAKLELMQELVGGALTDCACISPGGEAFYRDFLEDIADAKRRLGASEAKLTVGARTGRISHLEPSSEDVESEPAGSPSGKTVQEMDL